MTSSSPSLRSSTLTRPPQRLSIFRVAGAVILGVSMFALGLALGMLLKHSNSNVTLLSPLNSFQIEKEPINPYAPYTFAALRSLILSPRSIRIEEVLDSEPAFTSYLVSWQVPDLSEPTAPKKVTGQLNIPTGKGPFPVLIMLRGYVEREEYQTGVGTKNAAAAFAQNGYITIAPDFLGYAGSDAESTDVLIARFSRPLVVLQLLKNLSTLTIELAATETNQQPDDAILPPSLTAGLFDTNHIGIWAHSNGGQIALSILEITSRTLPTTFWAPVSKPFPYSVLYFNDELPDGGQYFRRQLALFEYELPNQASQFSILHEPTRILAPVQIHQGALDDAVPLEWSQELAETLEDAEVPVELFVYPQADHNLQPNWNEAIQRDLRFFSRHL